MIYKVDFLAGLVMLLLLRVNANSLEKVGIDLFTGPTEVLIVADEKADPFIIATDLLC